LLLSQDFTAKLTDFGLSRVFTGKKSMTMCGSVLWVSPEILRGDPYDLASDVYSFALTVWEILNFEKPWTGIDPKKIPYLVTVSCQRPEDNRPHMPDYLRNLMTQCWADDPDSRPGIAEIVNYLERASSFIDIARQVNTDVVYSGSTLTPSSRMLAPDASHSESSFSLFSYDSESGRSPIPTEGLLLGPGQLGHGSCSPTLSQTFSFGVPSPELVEEESPKSSEADPQAVAEEPSKLNQVRDGSMTVEDLDAEDVNS